jgi:hypothetical protein
MVPVYRPKPWHLVFAVLFGGFELYVLWLAFNPNVDDDYRAYYIDRSSSCFPREASVATGYYPLGEPVTFVPGRNGYARDTLRWCGFIAANNQGIRTFGDYGILRLKFDMPDEDLLLSFSSFTNAGSKDLPQEAGVVVNGEKLATLTFTSSKRVEGNVLIPEAVAKKGDSGLEIRFEVPRIGPPGTNSEPVTLQLRLQALRVVPLSLAPPGMRGVAREADTDWTK